MTNLTCCFTGHRDIPANEIASVKEKLKKEVASLVEGGYTDFYAGGALGFDTLAALCVLEMKKENPNIRLHIMMPCANQTRGWSSDSVRLHDKINSEADEVVCLSANYYRGCMQVRNRQMVEKSNIVIAYLTKTTGGSAYTAEYARKKGLEIINIAEI